MFRRQIFKRDETASPLHSKYTTELRRRFDEGGARACRQYILSKRQEWKSVSLNVAVFGTAGSGKSTLINTIRGLTAEDRNAAPVDVVECTKEILHYSHPTIDNLKFWDVPGVGTPAFPTSTYLNQIQVDRFDFFMIMSKCRFTEEDLWLGNEIHKRKKQFFYVRSKVDEDESNHKKSKVKTWRKIDPISQIRQDIEKQLKCLHVKDTVIVFLINCRDQNAYDFRSMEETLIGAFPSLQCRSVMLLLNSVCQSLIDASVAQLESRIWKVSSRSAAVAAVPLPGLSFAVDLKMLRKECQRYCDTLGLQASDLGQAFDAQQALLQAVLNTPFSPTYLPQRLWTSATTNKGKFAAGTLVEASRIVPFVSCGIAYKQVRLALQSLLQQAKLRAIELIEEAVQQSAL